MSRELPSLFTIVLKNIANNPSKHINGQTVSKAFTQSNLQLTESKGINVVQILVDYITEAGRFTDEILPATLFSDKSDVCLKNAKISGRYVLKVIKVCEHSLASLDVSGCFQISDDCLRTILNSCPNLTYLNIKNCRKLTDKHLKDICSVNPALATLNIGGNFNMTADGVGRFVQSYEGLAGLREINLSGLMVSDDVITQISLRCSSLTSLGLGYADVSEKGLLALFTNMGPRLAALNVSWLSSPHAVISPSFLVESLCTLCPRLVDLDVSGARSFTAANLVALIEAKYSQCLLNPQEWLPFQVIRARFMSSPRSLVESSVAAAYPSIVMHC